MGGSASVRSTTHLWRSNLSSLSTPLGYPRLHASLSQKHLGAFG